MRVSPRCSASTVGTLVHLTLATVGLSAILVSSATAFTVVKVLGAIYLIVIGIRTLLGRADQADTDPQRPPRRRRRDFAEGVVVNILNPKTALFFLASCPSSSIPDLGQAWLQILVLGLTFMVLGLITTRCGRSPPAPPARRCARAAAGRGRSATSRARSSSGSAS